MILLFTIGHKILCELVDIHIMLKTSTQRNVLPILSIVQLLHTLRLLSHIYVDGFVLELSSLVILFPIYENINSTLLSGLIFEIVEAAGPSSSTTRNAVIFKVQILMSTIIGKVFGTGTP